MPRLTDFEEFQKNREKEHGAYTFHVSREKMMWVYVHPDVTKTVMADTFFQFIKIFIKKKFNRL